MRRLFIIIVLAVASLVVLAQQISEQQAKDRAIRYLNANCPSKVRSLAVESSRLKSARVEAKSIYAFNVDGGGYVIASADSRALPVLGYSDSGFIDWEGIPCNMRAWLMSYDEAIETLGSRKDFVDGISLHKMQKSRAPKPAIEPLIKTKWSQKEPYWNECPLYDGVNPEWQGKRCVTGCVATALAQVMNYYQWPQSECREIPAYDLETAFENEKKVWHIDSLPPVTFDWKNMAEKYNNSSTEVQQEAVATLMRYCGQAVYMNYSPEFSGSDHQETVEALVKYFGYDDAVRSVKRIEYGIDEWEDLIYSELAEGRPVQYGGLTDESGHSFICNGYDGNGFFLINWGWSGSNDGAFSLSVLNPYKTSSGSSKGLGFCMGQDAIIGLRPAPEGYIPRRVIPQAYLYEDDPIEVFATDSVLFNYLFVSYSYEEMLVDFALGTCGEDDTLTPIYKGDPADTIVYNLSVNYHEVCIDSMRYDPGESQVLYPMVKFYNIPGCDWQLLGSKEFHVTAGRTPEGRFFLYKNVPQLEIKNIKVNEGILRAGERSDIILTIQNKGEWESTVPLYLVPFYFGSAEVEDLTDETPYTQGEPMLSGAYLKPGMSEDVTFSYKPTGAGTVYLLLALADTTPLDYYFVNVADSIGTSIEDNIDYMTTTLDTGHKVAAQYTDLQGRRLQGRPSRKGIYIRNRRKEVIK